MIGFSNMKGKISTVSESILTIDFGGAVRAVKKDVRGFR